MSKKGRERWKSSEDTTGKALQSAIRDTSDISVKFFVKNFYIKKINENYIVTVRKNLHNSDLFAPKPAQYTTAVLPGTCKKNNTENEPRE